MCVFNNTFEETSDQRPTSSIHRFHSGGALFLTEGLGGDAGRSSAARSVVWCFLLRSAREASLLREASVDNAGAQALRPLRRERFVRSQTAPRVLQTVN